MKEQLKRLLDVRSYCPAVSTDEVSLDPSLRLVENSVGAVLVLCEALELGTAGR